MPWNHRSCDRCGQPVITSLPLSVWCATCQQREPPYYKARSQFRYEFPIDTALKALKFGRQLMYAPAFAKLLLPSLTESFAEVDGLVPVPLHRYRHTRRGFNQATEICLGLAKSTGLPINTQPMRIRNTTSQSGLSASSRRKNLHNAFAIRGPLTVRRPLLIDDVITTGATCNSLTEVLLRAGAEQVGVLTVARATARFVH